MSPLDAHRRTKGEYNAAEARGRPMNPSAAPPQGGPVLHYIPAF